MKTRKGISILLAILLLPVGAYAYDFYEDGTITDGNGFNTVNVWNDANVIMTGGEVEYCNIYETATLNYLDGDILLLTTNNSATAIVYASKADRFDLYNDSKIFLYNSADIVNIGIFDVTAQLHVYGYGFIIDHFNKMGGIPYYNGLIHGYWSDGTDDFQLQIRYTPEPFPQNNIILHTIPEPATLLLLIFGAAICKRH
jgi:hypothetical protein